MWTKFRAWIAGHPNRGWDKLFTTKMSWYEDNPLCVTFALNFPLTLNCCLSGPDKVSFVRRKLTLEKLLNACSLITVTSAPVSIRNTVGTSLTRREILRWSSWYLLVDSTLPKKNLAWSEFSAESSCSSSYSVTSFTLLLWQTFLKWPILPQLKASSF